MNYASQDDTRPLPVVTGGPGDPPDEPAERDQRALAVLVGMADERDAAALATSFIAYRARHGKGAPDDIPARDGRRYAGKRRAHRSLGADLPVRVAPGEETGGALAEHYDVPSAWVHRNSRWPLAAAGTMLVIGALSYRHVHAVWGDRAWRALLALWAVSTAQFIAQWFLSWKDRPVTVTSMQQQELDLLRVTVNVPVYNEDAAILDRALWALVNQSRPPDCIHVVDDGSTEDYSPLRRHWEGSHHHGLTEVRWSRQANQGKKAAQARTFTSSPDADIIVTVDSDSALARTALDEGLKPFADDRVQSVAGMVLVHNVDANWITRVVEAQQNFFQVVSCGAQSVLGGCLVNRGPLALYRAQLLREVAAAYVGETFLGRRVKLGDDAALTLFARGRGRTVQQNSAFVFSVYPETISHHLRQWTRWMRGSTIRNCWRIKYLPVRSYDWWFVLIANYLIVCTAAVPITLAATFPGSLLFGEWYLGSVMVWSYLTAFRILAIRRSDDTRLGRLLLLFTFPAANLWSMFVLRWFRFYGIATCMRQGWNARQGGVEVSIEPRQAQARQTEGAAV